MTSSLSASIKSFFSVILDSIFPLSNTEKELFSMTPVVAYDRLPKSILPPLPNTFSVFAYKDPRTTKLVWNIKYMKSRKAAEIGGYALFQELMKLHERTPNKAFLVIPMPITDRRRRERGFNQCELLAEELKKLDTNGLFEVSDSILKRTHHLSRQTLKRRAERLESARGIFSVDSEVPSGGILSDNVPNASLRENTLKNAQVVVIDDVITTGSTMKEAMETLAKAGFKNVRGLSLAH